jgi:tetraacyldisaccharide 4'-kinase
VMTPTPQHKLIYIANTMQRFNLTKFWREIGVLNILLLPFSLLFYTATKLRQTFARPQIVSAKVICVGNIVAGGAGKSPIVQMLASQIANSAIIMRGYGGTLSSSKQAIKVDINKHTATEVGDEAMMHAYHYPTYICPNRFLSAKMAIADGADTIIMDDGLQNHSLYIDEKILVIDPDFKFGNRLLLPAGPLRQCVKDSLTEIDKIYVISNVKIHEIDQLGKPVQYFQYSYPGNCIVAGKNYCALTAIANPDKFFKSLTSLGGNLIHSWTFQDHHQFTRKELNQCIAEATKLNAQLVVTEKDYVKIPEDLKHNFIALRIALI